MKPSYFLSLFMALTVTICSQAQSSPATPPELILGIPECYQKVTEWNKVKSALNMLSGVQVKAFCSAHDCILLQIDRNLQPSNQAIFDKIKEVNTNFQIFEKQGSWDELARACQDEIKKQE